MGVRAVFAALAIGGDWSLAARGAGACSDHPMARRATGADPGAHPCVHGQQRTAAAVILPVRWLLRPRPSPELPEVAVVFILRQLAVDGRLLLLPSPVSKSPHRSLRPLPDSWIHAAPFHSPDTTAHLVPAPPLRRASARQRPEKHWEDAGTLGFGRGTPSAILHSVIALSWCRRESRPPRRGTRKHLVGVLQYFKDNPHTA